ncbi:hypothetical protein BDD12DRAFT_880365 [Trichophaea hybrida]|nr:hypothetical protein BDD12DRAFT_880365 [Trichophaea hybrida]
MLVNLPLELLRHVISYADDRTLLALSHTCWTTRLNAIPFVYRNITIDFRKKGAWDVYNSFVRPGIIRSTTEQYTVSLKVKLGNTLGGERENIAGLFLGPCRNIEYLSIKRTSDIVLPLPKRGPCPQLKELVVTTKSTEYEPDIEDAKQRFLLSVSRAIFGSPKLERLTIIPEISRSPDYPRVRKYRLDELFSQRCFLTAGPRTLKFLYLDYWRVTPEGVQAMIPHIRQLTTLKLGNDVTGDIDALWMALKTEKIWLSTLGTMVPRRSMKLMEYLVSYQGLSSVFLRYDGSGDYELNVVPGMLAHKASLVKLSFFSYAINGNHYYSGLLSKAISKCKSLKILDLLVLQWMPFLSDAIQHAHIKTLRFYMATKEVYQNEVRQRLIDLPVVKQDSVLELTVYKSCPRVGAWKHFEVFRRVEGKLVLVTEGNHDFIYC